MALAKSHSDPDPKNRKPKAGKIGDKFVINLDRYARTEAIIDECYADYINGESRTHIVKKLKEGLYTAQDGKTMKTPAANDIFNAAFARIKADTTLNREEAMCLLLSRFDAMYNDCNLSGDHNAAIRSLENLAKLYGLDKPQTAIQINADTEKGVTINFGFDNEVKEEAEADGSQL